MEATVRLIDGEPNVAVQVFWRGSELNLLRPREEPVGRFLQRLGLRCGKLTGRQGGGDKKRAKKEKRGKQQPSSADPSNGGAPGDGNAEGAAQQGQAQEASSAAAAPAAAPAGPPPPRLLDAQGARVPDDSPVGEALQRASHVEIEGERLPIVVNPPSITKLEAFGKPLAGCPLTASMRCEFCKPEEFELRWLRQATAGAVPTGQVAGEGRILWVPEDAGGQSLTLRADACGAPLTGRPRAVLRVGHVEQVPHGWPERRLAELGSRSSSASTIRVVCYNILAVCYARSQSAVRDMYPYCPASALDMSYRQPLLGRELNRLDADLVFLQECGYAVFHKCLMPMFGQKYEMRISLKASKVSEGCALLVRRGAFQVLEEQEALFRNVLRSSTAMRGVLREVVAKWPDFLATILPKMSTVFQLSAVRHIATGEVIVLANTHLFFHPLARHIRLLQVTCFLQQVQEMREKFQGANAGRLPRCVVCGDLNAAPHTGAVQLLLKGEVPSDHPDWEFCSQFAWRDDEDEQGDAEDGGSGRAVEAGNDDGLDAAAAALQPLPQAQWQPGRGVVLKNPVGQLSDAYAGTGLAFTNYVQDFKATLDYILMAGGWRVAKVLPGVSEEDLRPEGGLPSALHPSDHLSIAADLELV